MGITEEEFKTLLTENLLIKNSDNGENALEHVSDATSWAKDESTNTVITEYINSSKKNSNN